LKIIKCAIKSLWRISNFSLGLLPLVPASVLYLSINGLNGSGCVIRVYCKVTMAVGIYDDLEIIGDQRDIEGSPSFWKATTTILSNPHSTTLALF
jgi:hypothetical protein